jgi:lysophospholipid acyltransferase (LPLAT)-like uncharacterized protein
MHNLLTKLFAFLFNLFLKFTCSSNRLSVTNKAVFEKYAEAGGNIFTFWHSRLFFLVYYYVDNVKKRKVSILVSMSKDGDYGAALVSKLKQDNVRGSTSRGGQKAIRNLAAKAALGNNIAITPDGPRGPAFKVNDGVIKLAQLTGSRIIPVSYDATRKRELKSWDSFILVKPFGRVHVAFADPIEVPKDIDADQLQQYTQRLQETLSGLDRICAEKLRRDARK